MVNVKMRLFFNKRFELTTCHIYIDSVLHFSYQQETYSDLSNHVTLVLHKSYLILYYLISELNKKEI